MFESFILAGGKSSRMKRDKAFLKLGNQTLLEHLIAKLKEITCKKPSIVIAEKSHKFQDFQTITDIFKHRGTLGGIHSALANCNKEYALIIACDYPFISKELLNYLLETAEKTKKNCIAPIQKDGIIQPLCAVYKTKTCLEKLGSILINTNKTPAAKEFLKDIDTKFINYNEYKNLPNSEFFFVNVNSPTDYEKSKKIFAMHKKTQT